MENLVGYAKSDLPTHLMLGDNLNLAKNNESAKAWCQEVNAAMHNDIAAAVHHVRRLNFGRPPIL